jgi:hypothetical protein
MKFPFLEVSLIALGLIGMVFLAIKELPGKKKKNKNQ